MIALIVLAAVVVVIGAFAVYETVVASRDRKSLLALQPEAASQQAAAEVVRARSEFTLAVEAYERGMANVRPVERVVEPASLFGGGGGGGDTSTVLETAFDPQIAALEARKEEARRVLIEAQRVWDEIRPVAGAESSVDLWAGHGVLRGWQLGPIGFERAFVRVEHVLDPTLWAAFQTKRMRWGLALGAETQRLALFSAAVPVERMKEIVSQGMGGAEVALRPGFSPQRWWRRRNRLGAPRRATSTLLQTIDLAEGPDEPSRQMVRKAFEVEMGSPPEQVSSLEGMDGILSVLAAGPTVIGGFWWGSDPTPELLAGSAHTGWRESN